MRRFFPLFALLAASLLVPPAAAGNPASAKPKRLAPGQVHEECMALRSGQQLAYSYETRAPLEFNIHYHAGKEVFYPVKRESSTAHQGVFEPTLQQVYCMMWTNLGKKPALLRYRPPRPFQANYGQRHAESADALQDTGGGVPLNQG